MLFRQWLARTSIALFSVCLSLGCAGPEAPPPRISTNTAPDPVPQDETTTPLPEIKSLDEAQPDAEVKSLDEARTDVEVKPAEAPDSETK